MDITTVTNEALVEKTIQLAVTFGANPSEEVNEQLKIGEAEILRRLMTPSQIGTFGIPVTYNQKCDICGTEWTGNEKLPCPTPELHKEEYNRGYQAGHIDGTKGIFR